MFSQGYQNEEEAGSHNAVRKERNGGDTGCREDKEGVLSYLITGRAGVW